MTNIQNHFETAKSRIYKKDATIVTSIISNKGKHASAMLRGKTMRHASDLTIIVFLPVFLSGFLGGDRRMMVYHQKISTRIFVWEFTLKRIYECLDSGRKTLSPRFSYFAKGSND